MSKIEVVKLHSITGHNDSIYTIRPQPDNRYFFSAAGDGMIVHWDLENPDNGQLIAQLPNSIYALHCHQPSGLLIAGQNYEGIHVLNVENKMEVGSLQLTKAAIFDIQSYKEFLFVATGEGMLYKVNVNDLSIQHKSTPYSKSARAVAIHEERGDIAVGYSDNFIRVFDLDSLSLKFEWQAHDNSVFTVQYSPDGNSLLSGSRDARLKSWDVQANYGQQAEVVAHMYAINHIDYSPDAKHFVTCSLDKSIKVWDANELKLLKVIDRARHGGHRTSVNKVLWTAHHDQLLSASDDRTISVWHLIF